MIDVREAAALVEPFGFVARPAQNHARPGFWLAPFTIENIGIRRIHDDCTFVSAAGEIEPLTINAQAYLAAVALAQALED